MQCSLQRKDILLLFVAVGDIAVAVGQVKLRLVVVGRAGVLGVLVEADFALVQNAVQVDPRPAVVQEAGGGARVGRERWRKEVEGRWWLGRGGVGEGGGVRPSCTAAVAKLTPHSPDQSRQVDRRDESAPRREEETHRWTKTDERQIDGQMDGRGGGVAGRRWRDVWERRLLTV